MGVWNGVELDRLTIIGRRLTLRPWRPDDAAAVYDGVAGDAGMRDFLPIPDPYTSRDADQFVTEIATAGRRAGSGFSSALVETATGRLVGGADLRLPVPFGPHADIGYAIYPPYRRLGLAVEAVDNLARWAFEYGMRRAEIRCSVRNLASARTALAAGFRYEGIRRADLPTRDHVDDAATFVRMSGDSGDPVGPVLPLLPPGGLRDDVLALRVVQPGDTAALIEEHDDPISMSWAFDDRRADPNAVAASAAASELQWLVGPIGRLAMVEQASGAVAGFAQLRSPGPPQVFGVGYGVLAGYRGHGYTTRALRLLMAWAFDVAGIARLELGAKVANIASQKSALNAGFVADGVRRARLRNPDGTFSDEARFAAVNPNLAP